MTKFSADLVSDQKRLARGEQILFARNLLRARDHAHNKKWRVLMLAGGTPAGEINAIKEVMPQAHITAVDRDEGCIMAAIESGADFVVLCDLNDFERKPLQSGYGFAYKPNRAFNPDERFDLIHFDFCGGLTPQMRKIVSMYRQLVTPRGAYIVAFSYGRDVVEAMGDAERDQTIPKEVPDGVAMRIAWLLGRQQRTARSVITYKGANMPMCSVLTQVGWQVGVREEESHKLRPASYVALQPGDFELAVTCPDPSKLYDSPQERIESLRRSHIAIRASYARKNWGGPPTPLPDP